MIYEALCYSLNLWFRNMINTHFVSLQKIGTFCLCFSLRVKMEANSASKHLLLWLLLVSHFRHSYCSVSYDRKTLIINGQRRIILSGSIHYPRSTPEMWEGMIQKAKDGGLDAIDTYVFWNLHEPSPGNYNFEGRCDLIGFIKLVQKAGLFLNLRIGPYVCAEWNFGGFPVWLKYVPGISFRTDNEPFKGAMQRFTQKIVQMVKDERLFQSQGGPIILAQIENEYGFEVKDFGAAGHAYMTWAAKMAVDLNTGVPWTMCKEDDAPDPVINTCNGFYCDYFSPNKPYKPIMWTEAWTGWFEDFGGPIHHRPVEDLAFAVARFIQKGGSFVNYYMYHGGTNFGRTAGGPFVTTSYDYDAPIDEYGLLRQPKYDHLKELHRAIKICEPALVSADPIVTTLGNYEQAHVFSSKSGQCAAFLSNYHMNAAATVKFRNMVYHLPPWSISILQDCTSVIFNTALVKSRTSLVRMLPTNVQMLSWETFNEDIWETDADAKFSVYGLLDQLNVTRDETDYLWYITSIEINPSESFLHNGRWPILNVDSAAPVLHVFVNGQLAGSSFGSPRTTKLTFSKSVKLHAGINNLALLSVAVGLPNDGPHFETRATGIVGPVILRGMDRGPTDLSRQKWSYKVGLRGESMDLSSVDWNKWSSSLLANKQQPLTWYKAYFLTPQGEDDDPLALDMGSMGKGQAWINGQSIGRYWTVTANGACNACNYSGTYRAAKCQDGCGKPTQRWYHVPRSWLKPVRNLLLVFEEIGGDASRISLVRRSLVYV